MCIRARHHCVHDSAYNPLNLGTSPMKSARAESAGDKPTAQPLQQTQGQHGVTRHPSQHSLSSQNKAQQHAQQQHAKQQQHAQQQHAQQQHAQKHACLLYTSDAADEEDSVDLGGRRIIKKKNRKRHKVRACCI
eukprot:TRINITY_DN49459_c0_g1_i1.p1 TRINITY_DN49459_c0_g1~~TRINITY_DN49459_c0_g1_i1.p1  ORF type:complete len:152 (-),score=27.93 TRINITY_DN49459_c0_g1_i1:68-469(-)